MQVRFVWSAAQMILADELMGRIPKPQGKGRKVIHWLPEDLESMKREKKPWTDHQREVKRLWMRRYRASRRIAKGIDTTPRTLQSPG